MKLLDLEAMRNAPYCHEILLFMILIVIYRKHSLIVIDFYAKYLGDNFNVLCEIDVNSHVYLGIMKIYIIIMDMYLAGLH